MKAIFQGLKVEADSAWRYYVYLGNRLLGLAGFTGIVADLLFDGVPLPPTVYALLLLGCVGMGWVEMRDRTNDDNLDRQEMTGAHATPSRVRIASTRNVRTGFNIVGGSTKVRGATIANMDVAFRARDADVDLNDVEIL